MHSLPSPFLVSSIHLMNQRVNQDSRWLSERRQNLTLTVIAPDVFTPCLDTSDTALVRSLLLLPLKTKEEKKSYLMQSAKSTRLTDLCIRQQQLQLGCGNTGRKAHISSFRCAPSNFTDTEPMQIAYPVQFSEAELHEPRKEILRQRSLATISSK